MEPNIQNLGLSRLTVRIWVIILAVVVAYVIYQKIVEPKILQPYCLINTNTCLRIRYRRYKNSVLVHMQPTGFWVWFDGKDVLIYGEPTGRLCMDDKYDTVYVYDVSVNKVIGYRCAKKISEVQQFYDSKKAPVEYLYQRHFKSNFDVYDLINFLADRGIINLNIAKKTKQNDELTIAEK